MPDNPSPQGEVPIIPTTPAVPPAGTPAATPTAPAAAAAPGNNVWVVIVVAIVAIGLFTVMTRKKG